MEREEYKIKRKSWYVKWLGKFLTTPDYEQYIKKEDTII